MMNNLFNKKKRGFTVVEALVAVAILSLSIVATFGAVQNGLQYSGLTKDEITAFYLIQESIEYVKNIRDENALYTINGSPRNWLYGISNLSSDACYFGKVCQLDMNSSTKLTQCTGGAGNCSALNVDPSTGAYGYNNSWSTTSFEREMQLSTIPNNTDEVRLVVTVSWNTRGQSRSIQVSELLYNR